MQSKIWQRIVDSEDSALHDSPSQSVIERCIP
jgi:hypothetical protein